MDASEKVNFRCSSCGKALRASAQSSGKKIRCPGCQQMVSVPQPRSASAPAAAQQAPRAASVPAAVTASVGTTPPASAKRPPAPPPPVVATLAPDDSALLETAPPPATLAGLAKKAAGLALVEERWADIPNRAVGGIRRTIFAIDRWVLMVGSALAALLGLLMAARLLRLYGTVDDWETGVVLLLAAIPAYGFGYAFHRLLRRGNRYYIPLMIFYLPPMFFLLAWLGMTILLPLVGARADRPNTSVGPFVALTSLGYAAILGLVGLGSIRRDLRTRCLPRGSFLHGFAIVLTLIGGAIAIYAFYEFTTSRSSDLVTEFMINGAVACCFTVPAIFMANNGARLIKADLARRQGAPRAAPRPPQRRS